MLFVTGYAENAALNHGHIERGMEVLTKPFIVNELVRRGRAAADRRRLAACCFDHHLTASLRPRLRAICAAVFVLAVAGVSGRRRGAAECPPARLRRSLRHQASRQIQRITVTILLMQRQLWLRLAAARYSRRAEAQRLCARLITLRLSGASRSIIACRPK